MSLGVARHDIATPGPEPIKDVHPFDALATQLADAKRVRDRISGEFADAQQEVSRIEAQLLEYYERALSR